jgi:hypothetical protein
MGLEKDHSIGRELFSYFCHTDDNNNNDNTVHITYIMPIMILCILWT